MEEVKKVPEANKVYQEFMEYMADVERLGFQHFPEEEYVRMMEYNDVQKKLQKAKGVDTKSKKNLFIY